jgi:hypothetical protein
MVDVSSQMRGGDKAPVLRKAEVKADRYAPFFKNVDESSHLAARCLTAFGQNRATAGRRQDETHKDETRKDETRKGCDS